MNNNDDNSFTRGASSASSEDEKKDRISGAMKNLYFSLQLARGQIHHGFTDECYDCVVHGLNRLQGYIDSFAVALWNLIEEKEITEKEIDSIKNHITEQVKADIDEHHQSIKSLFDSKEESLSLPVRNHYLELSEDDQCNLTWTAKRIKGSYKKGDEGKNF